MTEDKPRWKVADAGELARMQGGAGGARCPQCDCPDSRVLHTYRVIGGKRRRRRCDHCGHEFTSEERTLG